MEKNAVQIRPGVEFKIMHQLKWLRFNGVD